MNIFCYESRIKTAKTFMKTKPHACRFKTFCYFKGLFSNKAAATEIHEALPHFISNLFEEVY